MFLLITWEPAVGREPIRCRPPGHHWLRRRLGAITPVHQQDTFSLYVSSSSNKDICLHKYSRILQLFYKIISLPGVQGAEPGDGRGQGGGQAAPAGGGHGGAQRPQGAGDHTLHINDTEY